MARLTAIAAIGLCLSTAAPAPAPDVAGGFPEGPDTSPRGPVVARLMSQPPLGTFAGARRPRVGADRRGRFTGPPALDLGPQVRLTLPSARHAAVGSLVQLEFSEPMDPASVAGSFRIVPDVPGALEWTDGRTLVFRPAAPLAYRTTYRVGVAGLPAGGGHLSAQGSFEFATVWPPPAVPYPFTLTFDDCASADAIQAILSALADRSLTAIFFPTGQCRDQFPWLVPALLAAGHRVCNHTYSHADLSKLSSAAIRSEIQRGVAVGCDLFRPPYGSMDKAGRVAGVAASLGYRIQLWDVDTRDWAGTPADVMVGMIRARGGVVLMHLHGAHTVEAIRAL
ncbi:MAG TPA: polysaccharide deacetylase family protein [Candidatus Dormibacteraeota bacterium]|nr:polysaccharide deacetylase family protein [Candidatus Dormibacteraeota bacterium]